MRYLCLAAVAAVAAVAAASPAFGNDLVERAKQPLCSKVARDCTGAQEQNRATYYCASILGTPVQTVGPTATITAAPSCGNNNGPARNRRRDALPAAAVTTAEPQCLKPLNKNGISSACNCLSLPPTVTRTLHHTVTAIGPFSISASGASVYGSSSSVAVGGYYATASNGVVAFATAAADTFYLNPDGSLSDSTYGNYLAFEYTDPHGNEPVALDSASDIAANGYQPLTCSIADANCNLNCKVNGEANNFICYPNPDPEWYISPNAIAPRQCFDFQPQIEY